MGILTFTNKFYAIAAVIALYAVAGCPKAAHAEGKRVIELGGKKVTIVSLEKDRVQVSEDCIQSSGKPKCDAYRALKKVAGKKLPAGQGRNPGALACEAVKGTPVIAEDSELGTATFCLFGDGSLISCDSLAYKIRD